MNTEEFIQNLKKWPDVHIELGAPATIDEISQFERKAGVALPEQVVWFYQACNGLKSSDPAILIKALAALTVDSNSKIEFAVFDNQHGLSFDTSSLNEAGQWDIINSSSGFIVTKTMASFWSNKVIAWLDKRRNIWQENIC